ncbi:hypothetical protein [Streptomyces purpureus]|uniref:Uncharacterized protein n=1 Tax=Streptomyces purpureus TaxID=1951 RepID=A0A918LVK6_9ACTN|nr:hypothetical protein [Streptomyces purpureus]GGT60025.1 hypothetical protein GCM10014713_61880 [Streptomyces purpureus]
MTRAARPAVGLGAACGDGSGTTVARVRSAVRRLVALDAEQGATAAMEGVRETLREVPELTAPPVSLTGLGGDLLAALAELTEVIGWILFDAGLPRHAHRANLRALALAERAGDRWTARLVLLNHSMLGAYAGQPRAALESAARVVGARPLPARVDSLVLIRQAHATALLGGHDETLRLLSRARGRFLDGLSRHDPPWAWWIDETELLGHRGWVLARLRQWDRAVPLLYEAATAPGPSYRHLFGAELLSALVGAGAWREAEGLIEDLAPRAARIGSVRTTERLGGTARATRAHTAAPARLRDAAAYLLDSLPASAAGTSSPNPRYR